MLVRAIDSSPSPLILPFFLAEITVPDAVEPAGIAVLPPTLTGCASVARKVWPSWLSLELNPCSNLTVRLVPAGTTIGWGLGFSSGGGAAAAGIAAWSCAIGADAT